jgi:superfamily II DNA or RNA helicase
VTDANDDPPGESETEAEPTARNGDAEPAVRDVDGDTEPTENDPAPAMTAEEFRAALEALGRPVATADEVARTLDWTHAEASDALDELADMGGIERTDVADDPVVWYPSEFVAFVDREHVVVFPDRREIVVEHPEQFTRAQLTQFAHLADSSGEGAYIYEIREEDVWWSPHDHLDEFISTMRDVLPERAPDLEEWIASQWDRARQFALTTHPDGYTVLEAANPSLMGNVARQHLDDEHLHAPITDTKSWVVEGSESEIKRTLYDAGYPVQDQRDLERGAELDVDLGLELREYQREWVEQFLDTGAGVLVGPPGSGKTIAAIAALADVGGETLVLAPSRELAGQWRSQLLAHTDLDPDQVGEYHGGEKSIRPVTIATYQTAGMDRHRKLFDERRWGLIVYDECLAGDTVVETSDGRRTFAELDAELALEEGWNRDIDIEVRTFSPTANEHEWVTATGVYKTEAPVQRIETNTGRTLRATRGHTHLVFDPETAEISAQTGLKEGDFVLEPLGEAPAEDDWKTETRRDTARAELMGWFIGDGHLNQYGDIKFSFARRASEQIDIIADLCETLDADYSVFENARGDWTLHAPKLRSTLGWDGAAGNKTRTVSVPSESYRWSKSRVGALLRGLLDAEGSVGKDSARVEFDTTSEQLARDVDLLLQKLGMLSRWIEIEREAEAHGDVYRLTVPSYYNERFEKAVGFRLKHKADRLTGGSPPATALPLGEVLESIKTDLHLTNEELAEMCGASKQVVGDVIRGQYRIGQQYLQPLADSLSTYAEQPVEDHETAKERYNVTYDRLSDAIDISVGHAYRLFERSESAAIEAIEEIVADRKDRAAAYAETLRTLSGMCLLEVVDIKDSGVETVYDFETESHTFLANGILTHNCQHIPSKVFRRSADLQAKHRLGLSATPVREDDKESEIFTLIGPPIGTDWAKLFEAGFVAEPEVELRYVPWGSEIDREAYASAEGHERRQVAGTNSAKLDAVRSLLDDHSDAKALVFVDWLDQGTEYAEALDIPFISGETRHPERERLFDEFRRGERTRLLVSRVGDEGIDLPNAEVAIVASGLGGSRRQASQRAGRTMRPAGNSRVYVLATRGTREEDFVRQQLRHLAGKGVRLSETEIDP